MISPIGDECIDGPWSFFQVCEDFRLYNLITLIGLVDLVGLVGRAGCVGRVDLEVMEALVALIVWHQWGSESGIDSENSRHAPVGIDTVEDNDHNIGRKILKAILRAKKDTPSFRNNSICDEDDVLADN